jgi:molybdopterin molybdotransferase
MLELEEAQRRILDATEIFSTESIPLAEADGRVLAEKIISPIDLPRFDNSAVDGYAVQSKDLKSASREKPVSLRLVGKIAAGESSSAQLNSGECIRIFTGSPMPAGADAASMQEDTQPDPRSSDQVQFFDSAKPWENIRFKGEDVKTGATLVEAGVRFGVGQLSLLAAVGVKTLRVGRAPILGVLATGSELREPGDSLKRGEIFESNRIAIASLARKIGAIPKIYPLVSDTLAGTKAALGKSFSECDAVVTTGGVSVGELDFVKTAFTELGGALDFWKVSIKPGKPFVFGKIGEKLLFGLPGNPVSALVTFILLAAPALLKMQGSKNFSWPNHSGVLAESLENRGGRRHFVRVSVDAKGNVHSAGTQASHILSSLANANGLVEVPPETTLALGSIVSVIHWEI